VPAGPRLVARRTTLVLGAAALAVSGCDNSDTPDPADGPSSTPQVDPDTELVDAVLVDLGIAEELATTAGLPELAAMHRAHIDVLEGDPPLAPTTTRRVARAAVPQTEQRLQRRLEAATVAAESGPLARLFASMSAAVSQRLA